MNKPTRSVKSSLGEIISDRIRFCLTFEQVRKAQIPPVVSIMAWEWKKMKGKAE